MPFLPPSEQAMRSRALQEQQYNEGIDKLGQSLVGIFAAKQAREDKAAEEERKMRGDIFKTGLEKGDIRLKGPYENGQDIPEGMFAQSGWLLSPDRRPSFDLGEYEQKKQIEAKYAPKKPVASDKAKILPANKATDVAEPSALNNLLKDLESAASVTSEYGPVTGPIAGINPYDEKAQTFQSAVTSAAQRIGKYLEGGVLRAEDVPKYAKMLPKLGDTPEVRQNKIENVRRLILQKQQNDLGALGAAGYDVAGFESFSKEPTPVPKVLRPANNKFKNAPPNMTPEQFKAWKAQQR